MITDLHWDNPQTFVDRYLVREAADESQYDNGDAIQDALVGCYYLSSV